MVQLSDWLNIWDRTSDLVKQQAAGVAVYEKLNKFLHDFSKLQSEAFAAQKKLCEKYFIDTEKYFGHENSYADTVNAFLRVVQTLIETENLIACSFEILANGEFKSGCLEQKRKLKQWKHNRDKLSTEMKSQVRIIDDEIKRYRDKYVDMIKSTKEYNRIESDKTHSQLDVEKALMSVRLKTKDFDRARKDYEAALNQFNLYRKDHFTRTIPLWAEVGSQLSQERYSHTFTLFSILVERFNVTLERLSCVCSDMQNIPGKLQFDQDMDRLLSHLPSGIPHPGDIEFVDLAANASVGATSITMDTVGEHSRSSWPSTLYPSVSAADLAAWENAGLFHNDAPNGGQIYAAGGSLYSGSSVGMCPEPGTMSRRPSISNAFGSSGTGGPGLLRRIFSRRSRTVTIDNSGEDVFARRDESSFKSARSWRRSTRHLKRSLRRKASQCSVDSLRVTRSTGNLSVATLGHSLEGAGESEYPIESARSTNSRVALGSQHELRSPNRVRDLLDSSDFSDTSYESEQPGSKSTEDKTTAYAETSVLAGLHDLKTTDTSPSESPLHAPLAEPESASVTYSIGPNHSENKPASVNGYETAASINHDSQQHVSFVESAPTNTAPIRANGMTLASNSQCTSSPPKPSSPPASALPGYQPSAFSVSAYATSKDLRYGESASYQKPRLVNANTHSTVQNHHKLDYRQIHPRSVVQPRDGNVVVGRCTALYSFDAEGFDPCYLPFVAGEKFHILASSPSEDTTEWIRVSRLDKLEIGFVPTGYMEQEHYAQPLILSSSNSDSGYARNELGSPSASHRRPSQEPTYSRYGKSDIHSSPTGAHARLPHSPKVKPPIYGRLFGTSVDTDL